MIPHGNPVSRGARLFRQDRLAVIRSGSVIDLRGMPPRPEAMALLTVRAGRPGAAFAAVLLCAALLYSPSIHAVDLRDVLTDYTATTWSRKDGLIGPVWAFAQDANGFLWIGTDSGLVRFDGVRFISWEDLGGPTLPRLPIRALYIAPAGTLWVGFGGSGGVARIDNRSVTTYVGTEGNDALGIVTGFVEDKSGTIWASSANGLERLTEH